MSLFVFASMALPAAAAVMRSQLPIGSTLIVRKDATLAVAAVELWFRAPSIGFGDPTPGVAAYAANAVAASKLQNGESVSAAVKSVGGRLAINVYPDSVSVAASVPTGADARILRDLTTAYFTPVITSEGARAALRDVAVASMQEKFDPQQALHDAVFGAMFSGGPAHYSVLPTSVAEIQRVTLSDLQNFAQRAFRSSNAVIVVTGNYSQEPAAQIGAGSTDGRAMENAADSTRLAKAASSNAPFSEDARGLGWAGPPITDAKAATAMDFIGDYLFRPSSGIVAKTLDDQYPDLLFSGQFVTLHDPGVMLVELAGKPLEPAQSAVLQAIAAMSKPLGSAEFQNAQRAFEYHILTDTEAPVNQADNFGWYTVEGDPLYAPSDDAHRYLDLAASLDPDYVASIARKYLGEPFVVNFKATASPGGSSS